jgi:hypothetical protein
MRRPERARAAHYGRGGCAKRRPEASGQSLASGGTRGALPVGRSQAGQLSRGGSERGARGTCRSSPDRTSRWSGFG